MTVREDALCALLAPEHQEVVLGLLLSTRDVRIAVPCSVLSKGASGAGTKVVVNVVRRSQQGGTSLALDCGRWWRGAPTGSVWMDYSQLLQHANDDALRVLHRKLAAIAKSRNRGLSRTQSVPGRISFDELTGSIGSGGLNGSTRLQRTSSSGLPPSGLQRAGSMGLPPSGPSALRRTSSVDVPAGAQRGSGSAGPARSGSGAGLHRLSAPALRRSRSSFGGSSSSSIDGSRAGSPAESEDEFVTPEKLQQAAAEASAMSPTRTPTPPAMRGLPPAHLSFEDSAGPRLAPSGFMSPGSGVSSCSTAHPVADLAGQWYGASASTSVSASASAGSSPYTGASCTPLGGVSPYTAASCTPLGGASPGTASCTPVGGASPNVAASSCGGPSPPLPSRGLSDTSAASGAFTLSRQPTFSQPYFAEFDDELEAEASRASAALNATGGSTGGGVRRAAAAAASQAGQSGATTPRAAPAELSAENSGSLRAAQLLAAEEHMTAEELHEVSASFNHVFVPPWAVPSAQQQQPVVRTYREAGVQTSTGAAQSSTPVRESHTEEDASDHFQAFMQHFAASLPHLAMALADMHLGRGGQDPTFVKSQYYFNSLLQLKDEMHQLGERLEPGGVVPPRS